jgi:hypothetical protein
MDSEDSLRDYNSLSVGYILAQFTPVHVHLLHV